MRWCSQLPAGNTMMLNPDAFRLVRDTSRSGPFVSHDWWAYIIITGAGGHFIYDREPTIHYRAAPRKNLVGANNGALARMRRIRNGFAGTYRGGTRFTCAFWRKTRDRLTPEN